MKYRVEVDIAFVNVADAIAFLDHVETIKTKPYEPTGSEAISLYRSSLYGTELYDNTEMTTTDSVDFDGVQITH